MTLGGEDLEYFGSVSRLALWQALVRVWPAGWIHDDEEPIRLHRLSLYPPRTPVFFVYRDWVSYRAWELGGRTERYAEGMIMVHHKKEEIAFTSGGEGLEAIRVLRDLL